MMKRVAIFVIFVLLFPEAGLFISSESSDRYENSGLANEMNLSIVNRTWGSPSRIVAVNDSLIVAIGDRIEVRTKTNLLLDYVVTPALVADIDVSDNGLLFASCLYEGLILLRLNSNLTLQVLDYYNNGVLWQYPQVGNGFVSASTTDTEEVHIFQVDASQRLSEVAILDGQKHQTDGYLVVTQIAFTFYIWNLTDPINPQLVTSFVSFLYWRFWLGNGILVVSGMNDFFEPEFRMYDIVNYETPHQIYIAYDSVIFLSHIPGYIYVLGYPEFSSNQPRLSIMNTTGVGSAPIVAQIDSSSGSSQFMDYNYLDVSQEVLVGHSANSMASWDIIDLLPTNRRQYSYPGYITDIAHSSPTLVYFDIASPDPSYPIRDTQLVGDISDLKTTDRIVYGSRYSTTSQVYAPDIGNRRIPSVITDEWKHPGAELLLYNSSGYGLLSIEVDHVPYTRLIRWTGNTSWPDHFTDNRVEIASETLLVFPSNYYFWRTCIFGNLLFAASPTNLVIIDLDTLDWASGSVTFPDSLKMIAANQNHLYVLGNGNLTQYSYTVYLPDLLAIERIDSISCDTDMLALDHDILYTANITHLIKVRSSNDALLLDDSLRLPAYFPRATEDERILEAEPGEILLLPAEGRIFRTAGIYGVWDVFDDELFSLYNPETSTTTTGFETTTSSPPISTTDSTISTSSTTTGIIPSTNTTTTPDIEQVLDIWILSISVIAIVSEIIAFLFIIRRRDAGAKAT